MRSATEIAFENKLQKALYYAVREDFNAGRDPKATEKNKSLDAPIRWAIEVFEKRNRLPAMSRIEVGALARAALRRGMHPSQRTKTNESKL